MSPAKLGAEAQPGFSFFLDYELPPELIAQQPAARREASCLLQLDRDSGGISHHTFADLPEILKPRDLLVLNDTRVLPARLLGYRASTGGKWEGLFLRVAEDGLWELLSQSRGRLNPGEQIFVQPGPLQLTLEKREAGSLFFRPSEAGTPWEILSRYGQMPVPPYIRKGRAEVEDSDRYQTVFARTPGAVAAPTAGLHFSQAIFDRLKDRQVDWTFVTLHVGQGTFRPLLEGDPREQTLHAEWAELPTMAVEAIKRCKQLGGRVVAVGTTSVRVLETVAGSGELKPWSGETSLFIYPPYRFRIVDALVTNFHLPRTSLLLLVGAFAGSQRLQAAYEEAIARRYRFYSYGDAMLIV